MLGLGQVYRKVATPALNFRQRPDGQSCPSFAESSWLFRDRHFPSVLFRWLFAFSSCYIASEIAQPDGLLDLLDVSLFYV